MSILAAITVALYASLILIFWKRIKHNAGDHSMSEFSADNKGANKSDGSKIGHSRVLLVALILVLTVLHGLVLFRGSMKPPHFNLALGNVFSLVSLVTVFMFMVGSISRRILNLGILVMPMGLVGLIIGIFMTGQELVIENAPTALWLHLLIALLAFSFLCIATAQALLLYIQDKQLHRPNPGMLFPALPPIQTMEQNLFRLNLIGATLLTANLATGMLSSWLVHGQTFVFNHHILLSIIAWGGFTALLLGQKIYGWRGRIAAKWTMIAFGVLVLAYFGTRFVTSIILS